MSSKNDVIKTIDDLETLKVISDPLRLEIIQIIKDENIRGTLCSVKQISEQLDIPPAKLYYHVKLLEKHELLQVAETRIVSGIVEKLYRVSAYQIQVSSDLFSSQEGSESLSVMLTSFFNEILKDLQKIIQKHTEEAVQKNLAVTKRNIKLTPGQFDDFPDKLEAILKTYETENKNISKTQLNDFNLLSVVYPIEIKTLKPEE